MSCLEYKVCRIGEHFCLFPGRPAPEHKNNRMILFIEDADDRICKFLPADPTVGKGLMRTNRQNSI